jgi:hypothetical protein
MKKRSYACMKKLPKRQTVNSIDLLPKALTTRTKAEDVALIVEMAKDDRSLQRTLETRLKIEAPAVDLVLATDGIGGICSDELTALPIHGLDL